MNFFKTISMTLDVVIRVISLTAKVAPKQYKR